MGCKVWAYRVGNYPDDKSSGWQHSIRFSSLDDLSKELDDRGLRRSVDTLGIVAHGDTGGLVQLDQDLTPATIASFGKSILQLNNYFETPAKLMFLSCIAGDGPQGTKFLLELSSRLPNVHVIGFTIFGVEAAPGQPSRPGQMYEIESPAPQLTAKILKGLPLIDEYDKFSKWALNGYITKIPIQEQIKRPGYRCAWSTCPGHAKPTDRCVPAVRGLGRDRPYPR